MGNSIKLDSCCKGCKEDKTYNFEENLSDTYKENIKKFRDENAYDSDLSKSLASVVRNNIKILLRKTF